MDLWCDLDEEWPATKNKERQEVINRLE